MLTIYMHESHICDAAQIGHLHMSPSVKPKCKCVCYPSYSHSNTWHPFTGLKTEQCKFI